MSWQEELRRLDTELANGKITQHQHRKQRDELLAAASGGAAPSPVVSPLSRTDGRTGAGMTQPGRRRWQSANPGLSNAAPPEPPPHDPPAEPKPSKKPKPDSAALLSTTRQTTAPSPADERPTESMRFPELGEPPTVIRPAVRPPAPALPELAPAQPQQPPPRHTQPLRPFTEDIPSKVRRRAPTWLFLAGGVLVVLGMIIAATSWLGQRSDSGNTAPPTQAGAEAQVAIEDRLPALPGVPNPNNSTMSIDKGVELKLYTAEEAALMKANAVQGVIYRASAQGSDGCMVLVMPADSATGAAAVVKGLNQHAVTAGLRPIAFQTGTDNAVTGSNVTGQLSGTWYTSGSTAVALWVSQALGGDQAALVRRLAEVHDSVTAVLPAG